MVEMVVLEEKVRMVETIKMEALVGQEVLVGPVDRGAWQAPVEMEQMVPESSFIPMIHRC